MGRNRFSSVLCIKKSLLDSGCTAKTEGHFRYSPDKTEIMVQRAN